MLPTSITQSSVYTIGINDRGEREALVFCLTPYPECPGCHTVRAIVIVDERREFRCCYCAGKVVA